MSNNTLKNFGQSNFGQSLMSDRPDKVTNFLLSTGVEELDDAASAAVNGGAKLILEVRTDDPSFGILSMMRLPEQSLNVDF